MEANQTQAAATRLAAKLDRLDLDDEERTVLMGILDAGATSIEPVGDEVQGFLIPAVFGLRKQGEFGLDAADESPKENVTFEYGGLQISYAVQGF